MMLKKETVTPLGRLGWLGLEADLGCGIGEQVAALADRSTFHRQIAFSITLRTVFITEMIYYL